MSDPVREIEVLSPKKRALFELLLKERKTGARPAPAIPQRKIFSPAPLSYGQEQMWFLEQLQPGSAQYNQPAAVRFFKELDAAALERSLLEVIRRHEVLRTTFDGSGPSPAQVISPAPDFRLRLTDLSHLPHAEREAEARRLSEEEACRPFDLRRGPLMRCSLLRLSVDEHVLLLTLHHIVTDGWSMGVLFRELTALYAAYTAGRESPLEELPVQYADYAAWQRGRLEGGALKSQLAYWREKLSGAPPVLELPADRARPSVQGYRGATALFELGELGGLKEVSRQEGVTQFMALLAGFAALLHRYSGRRDIVIGTLVANRTRPELESLVGYFINTLALRTDMSGTLTFRELLRRVREACLGAYANQDVPFERLVEELRVKRDPGYSPLFQVMFNLINLSKPATDSAAMSVSRTEVEKGTAKFDLSLEIEETEQGLLASFNYNTDLFEAATIERMAGHYRRLLGAMLEDLDRAVADLPLLDAAAEARSPGEDADVRLLDMCAHQLFEEQAARTPGAVAVSSGDVRLTYQELNERANRLARSLVERGIGPDSIVALLAPRGVGLLTAILAVFKAGGAYLPLDPAHPAPRLKQILAQSKSPLVLVPGRPPAALSQATESLPEGTRPEVLDIEELPARNHSPENLPARSGPRDLAYVIYTSGSTGVPKGVMVEHRGMLNHLLVKIDELRLAREDIVAQTASQCFDISVWQFLAALLVGGRVHVVSDDVAHDPRALLAEAGSAAVSVLESVPTLLRAMLEESGAVAPSLSSLRWLIATGEALPPELCQRWLDDYPRVPLLNAYGPTECSDDVTHYAIREALPDGTLRTPIGRAVRNARVYVLDRALRPAPIGVPGELCVGGLCVGRGYLRDPARTAEVFVPDPLAAEPGARLYKTGDLARYRSDGEIEYLGRLDHQVKIRGFRIELGEVEAVLGQHEGVREAVVLAREETPGDKRLVAYVVSRAGDKGLAGELRGFVKERLPEYMMPSVFVMLDELPLTPNGKVDRKALPAPGTEDFGGADGFVAPRGPVEEVLAGIWAQALNLERVGVHEKFFDLGGYSLLVIQIISRIRETFHVEIPVRALFESPTVAELATLVEEAIRAEQGVRLTPLKPVPRDRPLPLSYGQERFWFLEQLEPGNPTYHISAVRRLIGVPDVAALERSLGEVVRRHEVLHTSFRSTASGATQVISPPAHFRLPVTDLSHLPPSQREREAQRLAEAEACLPFNLEQGPMLRASLLRLSVDEHVLLLTLHHIVTDGWSMGILFAEVTALYAAYTSERESPLEELPVQYADYAAWQREWMEAGALEPQLGYWREKLSGAPAALELPTDRARPAVQGYRGATTAFKLGGAEALREASRQEGVTQFMALLAGFAALLHRYSGQRDILVGTPVANRTRPELESLVGYFANTLVLRVGVTGEESGRELLWRVREACLGAYANQDVPFERLVEELQPERNRSHAPFFQVVFALHNNPKSSLELKGLTFTHQPFEPGTARADLTLEVGETKEGLVCSFEYNTDLFEAATIERMAGHYRRLLGAMLEDLDRAVADLPLLDAAEAELMLVRWNQTRREYPRELCAHQLFEEQVKLRPEAVAVMSGETRLTYAELNRRANRLAHHLRSLGVGPEVLVGLCVEPSADLAVGVLGILKAGGAFLPLDASYPLERLSFMLDDAGVPVLVTQEDLLEALPTGRAQPVCLDADRGLIEAMPAEDVSGGVAADNLAYVIYTSGSTDRPKGALLGHRGLCNLVRAQVDAFGVGPGSRVLQFASPSFDASVWEIVMALMTGATLCFGERGRSTFDGALLLETMERQGVTVATLPPSVLSALPDAELPALRTIISAGESCPPELVARWSTGRAFFNAYGPTEATVCASMAECDAGQRGTPPIGTPLGNVRLYILDRRGSPVPAGVAGELHIGGVGLARGYLNRAALTAEKFLPDAFGGESGARLYRTGDLARFRAAGRIEYLGRIDFQVKIRGHRVELGEIEAALGTHPAVRQSVVLAREDAAGGQRVVAYVVAEPDAAPAAGDLRRHLAEKLPEYMMPSAFVMLEEMPLTPNGKVNRSALPAPERGGAGARHITPPRTPAEKTLMGIWCEVLGVESASVDDNFFEVGGHSLLATQLVSRVRERMRRELPLQAIFEKPTVAALAGLLQDDGGTVAADGPPSLGAQRRNGSASLSLSQERLWLASRARPDSPAYNTPLAFRLRGALSQPVLQRCFDEILRRHEILRTVFGEEDGRPVQRVQPSASLRITTTDFSGVPDAGREAQAMSAAARKACKVFDLERGPLVRAELARLAEDEQILFLFMHHIVIDPWSLGVLVRELESLYAAYTAGRESPLEELPVQYADYAAWQRGRLEGGALKSQLAYWRERLAGDLTVLELPTDRPRPAAESLWAAGCPVHIPEDAAAALRNLCAVEGVTAYMLLLAAFEALLQRYTGQEEIVLGVPVANREVAEVEPLIGYFANMVVMRTDLSGDPTFKELLSRVRDAALGAFAHQSVPLEVVVREVGLEPYLERGLLSRAAFSLTPAPVPGSNGTGLRPQLIRLDAGVTEVDLSLHLWETAEGFAGHLVYKTDLYDAATASRIAGEFSALLKDAVTRPEQRLSALSPSSEGRL
jgi:amino acid adenylation domain-containing protein